LKSVEAAGIETLQLDTLSDSSITSSVAQVQKLTGGSLDTLLNNAGAGHSMPVMDLDISKVRDLFDLNVFSLISTTRAFLPLLRNSTATHGGVRGGMVVNNTSCSSLPAGAVPFAGAYNASKAAAANLTEVMRLELAPFGIKVVNLVTGGVRSTFHENAPKHTLPQKSIYNVAKEAIEKTMSGVEFVEEGSDPVQWATQVVQRLSKDNPSHWIYLGKWSTTVRLASFFPIGFTDSIIRQKAGLDVLERKLTEEGEANKF
jgi:1-acylglycerone phosphate reductase